MKRTSYFKDCKTAYPVSSAYNKKSVLETQLQRVFGQSMVLVQLNQIKVTLLQIVKINFLAPLLDYAQVSNT